MHRRRSCFPGLCVPVLCLASLFVVLGLAAGGGESTAATEAGVCGVLDVDTTWGRAGSPYTVTCDTILQAGARLDVEAGVEIRFAPGSGLELQGTLVASGTLTQPITFTSNEAVPARGDWDGLRFEAGSSASVLRWCTIEYATNGAIVYAVDGSMVSPELADCTVRQSALYGIVIEGEAYGCGGAAASPSIARCTVEQNTAAGIYYYGHGSTVGCTTAWYGVAGGTLSNSAIRDNGLGVRMRSVVGYGSKGRVNPTIDGNRIAGNMGSGVSMTGDDPIQAAIQNNLITGNGAAGIDWTADDPASDPRIVNNSIAANGGDGIVCRGDFANHTSIENNVLTTNGGYGLACVLLTSPGIAYNDVWGNGLGGYDDCEVGAGNLAADPEFADAAGSDFHLAPGSPCIDTGTSMDAPDTDLDGVPRPQGDGVDMGAYEFFLPESGGQAIEHLSIQGPEVGLIQRAYAFTATVQPVTVTLPVTYTWQATGQSPVTSTSGLSDAVSFAWEAAGPQILTATAENLQNRLTVTRAITLYRPVESDFGAEPTRGVAPLAVAFANRSRGDYDAAWWDLGDGATSAVEDPAHTYGAAGAYTVTLTVSGPGGTSVLTRSDYIQVYAPVQAAFDAAPRSGPAPLAVGFTNHSSGDYTDSLWDFGDGVSSTLPGPAHTYQAPGAYTVGLQVSGPGGQDEAIQAAYIVVEPYRIYLPVLLRADPFGRGLPERDVDEMDAMQRIRRESEW